MIALLAKLGLLGAARQHFRAAGAKLAAEWELESLSKRLAGLAND